ncbi:hypothetical protein E4U82_18240 [Lentibacillus salicampi]|uniref:Uncharacterized protein n=1 Tax=Lentibacillus salicampi TaxID=175306 RepID=A0A4Y9A6P8_9BACI|nr:hypothetical protein E4U82_18240 [Lentibacillus salicampi]
MTAVLMVVFVFILFFTFSVFIPATTTLAVIRVTVDGTAILTAVPVAMFAFIPEIKVFAFAIRVHGIVSFI